MFKVVLIIVVTFTSTFFGYLKSDGFEKRKKYYDGFLDFLIKLKCNVSFNQQTLNEFIEDNKEKNVFSTKIFERIINGKVVNQSFLTSEDEVFFEDFITNIGKNDWENEIKIIDGIIERVKSVKDSAEKDYIKNKDLYIKVGFLIGVMISVALL